MTFLLYLGVRLDRWNDARWNQAERAHEERLRYRAVQWVAQLLQVAGGKD